MIALCIVLGAWFVVIGSLTVPFLRGASPAGTIPRGRPGYCTFGTTVPSRFCGPGGAVRNVAGDSTIWSNITPSSRC